MITASWWSVGCEGVARGVLHPAQRLGEAGDRGWIGDNPFIYLDTARIRATGWEPAHGIREAVEATVDYLVEHRWILGDPVP